MMCDAFYRFKINVLSIFGANILVGLWRARRPMDTNEEFKQFADKQYKPKTLTNLLKTIYIIQQLAR